MVYVQWSGMPDRPFRCLVYMALVSLDTGRPPRYFGGYPALARALGRDTPDTAPGDSGDVESQRRWRADMEAVRNAVRQLVAAGAIVCDRAEAPGRGPEYALRLGPTVQAKPVRRSRRSLSTVQAKPVDLGGVGGGDFVREETTGTPDDHGLRNVTKRQGDHRRIDQPGDHEAERKRQLEELAAKYPATGTERATGKPDARKSAPRQDADAGTGVSTRT